MAMKFQVRGTQLDAYFATGQAKSYPDFISPATAPVLKTTGLAANTFGNSVIDCTGANGTARYRVMSYGCGQSRANLPTGQACSYEIRFTAGWSASPTTQVGLLLVADCGGFARHGLNLSITTAGKFLAQIRNAANTLVLNWTTTASWVPVAGTNYAIRLAWDGTTTASAAKIIIDETLFEASTAAGAQDASQTVQCNIAVFTGSTQLSTNLVMLNELAIFDTSVAATGSARTDFYSASAFNGENYTDPGIANVRSTTSYIFAGNTDTGTCVVPAAANVRHGTSVDATTGTAFIPTASDVRFGTSVDATTGTAHIPGASDVRSGTATDATTGTLAVPSPANVLVGIATDNTTGTLVIPSASSVASAVWDTALASHTTSTTFGGRLQKLLTLAKFLGLK